MSSTSQPPHSGWAEPRERLEVDDLNPGALAINVAGMQPTGPLRGFGQLWQKTYEVKLGRISPALVIDTWKANFEQFWPRGNHFYGPLRGITPGSVAVLNLAQVGHAPPLIATGVWVIYADEDSFSFLTPQGHMFAGMVTFSAFEAEGETVARIQALIRAGDPLYEVSLRLGLGHAAEDSFWQTTLKNLAAHFQQPAQATSTRLCLDPRVQWREARNLWHNAAIRTGLYYLLAPFRAAARVIGQQHG